VRVFHLSPEGRELTTVFLRPGQLLGTSALIGVGEQSLFAEAAEDSYVCEATADEFMRIMSGHPALAGKVIVTIARQAFHLEQKLERLAFEEIPVRLAQALLQLSEENGGQMPSHITHEELAKLISATRETVSKTLAQFAEQGAVELGYRRSLILDEQQLRQVAEH